MLNSREATKEEIEKTGLIHRVYLPEGGGELKPLVLLVHGRAGTAKVPWIFSSAVASSSAKASEDKQAKADRPIVIAPQAHVEDQIGGFSWWQVAESPEEESSSPKNVRLDKVLSSADKLKTFIEKSAAVYPIDKSRIYAVGFSQGGAIISILSLVEPDLFKGVAILSSFIPSVVMEDNLGREELRGNLPKYFIAHGTEDKVIPISRAEETKNYLEAFGAEVRFEVDDVKHKIGRNGMQGLKEWFTSLL